jgi:DNA polymerase-3 subunit gamma/tau
MRDALSILDRVLSLGEKKITDKILEDLLGKPPTAAIGELVQAIARGDAGAAITRADALLAESMGAEQLLSELIEFLRNVMLVVACGEKTELLDVPAESRGAYTSLAKEFDAPTLVHLIALCDQTQRSLKASLMHRPLLDALIVRLALSEQFSSLRDLVGQGSGGGGGDPKKKVDGSVNEAKEPDRSPPANAHNHTAASHQRPRHPTKRRRGA